MTVYLPKGGTSWYYDFRWRGRRYRDTTGQVRREDAELVESQVRLRVRQEAGGVAPFDAGRTPRVQDWAEVYYEWAAHQPTITRPDRIEHNVRVVLRFWGARPGPTSTRPAVEGEPYHDLRLGDVVSDPAWIDRFEAWMERRGVSGQTRNQYRSVMRQMFKLALTRRWRAQIGLTFNPFADLPRDRTVRRTVVLTPDELRRWTGAASYHVRLAVAIGALAPKLRLANVLALRWTDLDPACAWLTVHAHKTAARTGDPLVMPVSAQLRAILEDARARTSGPHVVTYRGKPVTSIRGGLRLAAARAGLHYGRADGVTYHVLRHTAATLLAELQESDAVRKDVMGHQRVETTYRYTHLRPVAEVAPLERLSATLPLADLVTAPRRRAAALGKILGSRFGKHAESPAKAGHSA